jgi:acyl carrier protein
MIVAVEKAFKIKLTTKEVQSLANVGELVSLVQRKLT